MSDPTISNVLPLPHRVEALSDRRVAVKTEEVQVRCDSPRIRQAAQAWMRSATAHPRQEHRRREPNTTADGGDSRATRLVVEVDRTAVTHPQGYTLRIDPTAIELIGGSDAGCFYGLQTLYQLSRLGQSELPHCRITDAPDFATRGLLIDVTRGRVPTLATLKRLIDRLAALKINQLQLYIEHAFVFSFDPEICDANNGLTPDEVRELDAYARDRFIDLVPAVATFGHMGRILSLPKYRHLAEIEATESWDDLPWAQRVRGLTLDCTNPDAHPLVERIWSDVLDAFSSPVVNICGDEPWDLGEGKNKARFADGGKGEAYIEHIRRTADFCAGRDRRCQAWSDVITNHPHLFDRLPPDLTILHWGYNDRADFDGTGRFVDAGLDTCVCPGTSGWKRIINAVDAAERNIHAFAVAGKRHGATGLLNTDWGDHGHFNLPACSWHGIALGAAKAWSVDHPIGPTFDHSFARNFLDLDCRARPGATDPSRDREGADAVARCGPGHRVEAAHGIDLLRKASSLAEKCETWRLMCMPMRAMRDDPSLPSIEAAQASREHAIELHDWCLHAAASSPDNDEVQHDLQEMSVAAQFTALLCDKIMLLSNMHDARKTGEWLQRLDDAATQYADCWSKRYKPSGLNDIRHALSAVGHDLRTQHDPPR